MERVRASDILRDIAKYLGRFREIFAQGKRNGYTHGRGEKYSLELGSDLSRALTSELAMLAAPETLPLFLRKYQRRQIKQYRRREPIYKGAGAMICCLDESGSTAGECAAWGKAVALTLLFLLGGLLSLLWSTLLSQTNALLAAAPAFFDAIPAAADDLLSRLEQFSASSPEWLSGYLHEQLFRAVTDADSLLRSLSSRAMAWLGSAAAALPGGMLAIATGVLAIFFTSASYPELCAALEHAVPEEAMAKLRLFRGGVMRSLARWLRAQATLSLITFSELLIGFLLMRQSYSLLLAFLITLLDALPVFGTGTALVPWAVFTLLFGFPPKAIVLLALYLCTLITRNTLEPKLLSAQAGLPPVASLFAMYLGYCTFGVAGMVLFPFLLLLFAQIRNAKAEAAA